MHLSPDIESAQCAHGSLANTVEVMIGDWCEGRPA
jgi:hypothetical protein